VRPLPPFHPFQLPSNTCFNKRILHVIHRPAVFVPIMQARSPVVFRNLGALERETRISFPIRGSSNREHQVYSREGPFTGDELLPTTALLTHASTCLLLCPFVSESLFWSQPRGKGPFFEVWSVSWSLATATDSIPFCLVERETVRNIVFKRQASAMYAPLSSPL